MPIVSPTPAGKVCTKCGRWLALSEYYQKRPGQLFSWCKACHGARTLARLHELKEQDPEEYRRRVLAWAKAHPERARESQKAYRERNAEAIRQREREQYPEKRKEKKAEYQKANADQIRQRLAKYREANRARRREADAAYREAHREELARRQREWREAHPERYQAIHRKWKQANKNKVNASTHRRRNTLTENGGHWTAEQWQALKQAQDFRCLLCGRREPDITLTVDHVVPVSKGGSNDISNLQGLCKPCNSTKHNRTLDLRT